MVAPCLIAIATIRTVTKSSPSSLGARIILCAPLITADIATLAIAGWGWDELEGLHFNLLAHMHLRAEHVQALVHEVVEQTFKVVALCGESSLLAHLDEFKVCHICHHRNDGLLKSTR
jgi:hypothetical protein